MFPKTNCQSGDVIMTFRCTGCKSQNDTRGVFGGLITRIEPGLALLPIVKPKLLCASGFDHFVMSAHITSTTSDESRSGHMHGSGRYS